MQSSQQENTPGKAGRGGQNTPGRVNVYCPSALTAGVFSAFSSTAAVAVLTEAGSGAPGDAMPSIYYTSQQAA